MGDADDEQLDDEDVVGHPASVPSHVYPSYYSLIPTGDRSEGEEISGPTSWCQFVERSWFQKIIGCIIFLNLIVLWGETDLPQHQKIWVICDNGFLTIFVFELACRLAYWGRSFLSGADKWWHLLDVCVVFLGVWDTWFIELLHLDDDSQKSTVSTTDMNLLRTLRLLRLIRLIRIIKIFKQIMLVIEGLSEVVHKFLWIFLALFFFIFCASIIMVKTLGEGIGTMTEEGMEDEAEFLRSKFRSVPASVFTLFQVATLDEWDVIANPIIKVNPLWRLFFIGFIAASWILVSVLTAVASNAMIDKTMRNRELAKKEQDRRQEKFIEFLRYAFHQADADGNETLDKNEFTLLTKKDYVVERMKELGIHLSEADFQKAWNMLDIDGSGELSIEEFVNGFSALHESLSTKHVVNIDYSLKKVSFEMETRLDRLESSIAHLRAQNEEMRESLNTQERMRDAQSLSLWLWQQWLKTAGEHSGTLTPEMAEYDYRSSGRTVYSKAYSTLTDFTVNEEDAQRDSGSQAS